MKNTQQKIREMLDQLPLSSYVLTITDHWILTHGGYKIHGYNNIYSYLKRNLRRAS